MKKLKIITMVILVIAIAMVSFFGVYTKVQNRMENQVRDYLLDMDLDGARYVRLSVNTESTEVIKDSEGKEVETEEEMTDEQIAENGYTKESVPNNKEEDLNVENYKKAKKIIEERLKAQGVGEYEVSLESETGDILIQIPENENTDNFVSNMNTMGKFEIIDADTKDVLMNNNDIKLVNVMYGASSSTSSGTTVYLNIEFNKEGSKKLEEISNTYVEVEEETSDTENETTEENTTENETTEENTTENTSTDENATENTTTESEETTDTEKTKEVTLKIDDEEFITTSFDEPIENGKLQLSMGGSATDAETLQDNIRQASAVASVVDSGNLPIQYDIVSNEYILSDVTNTQIEYLAIAVGIVLVIGLIIFVIRYKANGILSAISVIGLVGLYLLIIRYTNVSISIQGIIGIIITIILNYLFINKILLDIKKNENNKESVNIKELIRENYKKFFTKIMPIFISAIVFCFVEWTTISSFGMVMFWGIVLIVIYNYLITTTMLNLKAEK